MGATRSSGFVCVNLCQQLRWCHVEIALIVCCHVNNLSSLRMVFKKKYLILSLSLSIPPQWFWVFSQGPKFVFYLEESHLGFWAENSLTTLKAERSVSYMAATVITSPHSLNLEMGSGRLAAWGIWSFQGNYLSHLLAVIQLFYTPNSLNLQDGEGRM